MITSSSAHFDQQYQSHLKHLKLKGLQPKTIEAYGRAIRRIGEYFDHQIDNLTEPQLADYFSDLVDSHSWSSVKLDLAPFLATASQPRAVVPQSPSWFERGSHRDHAIGSRWCADCPS